MLDKRSRLVVVVHFDAGSKMAVVGMCAQTEKKSMTMTGVREHMRLVQCLGSNGCMDSPMGSALSHVYSREHLDHPSSSWLLEAIERSLGLE